MSNRVVGNVIIIDSAMGNLQLIESATGNFRHMHINAFAFWSSDSTGRCIFTGASTADHLISFGRFQNGTSTGLQDATMWSSFGDFGTFETLKIPVLTAGTAWVYLG